MTSSSILVQTQLQKIQISNEKVWPRNPSGYAIGTSLLGLCEHQLTTAASRRTTFVPSVRHHCWHSQFSIGFEIFNVYSKSNEEVDISQDIPVLPLHLA